MIKCRQRRVDRNNRRNHFLELLNFSRIHACQHLISNVFVDRYFLEIILTLHKNFIFHLQKLLADKFDTLIIYWRLLVAQTCHFYQFKSTICGITTFMHQLVFLQVICFFRVTFYWWLSTHYLLVALHTQEIKLFLILIVLSLNQRLDHVDFNNLGQHFVVPIRGAN